MFLKFNKIDDKLVVFFIGELDHHSAEEVRVKVDDRIDRDDVKKVILDFSGVTFMDSSGIGVVIGRYKKISVRNGQIAISAINKNIKRVFDLSGISKIIKTYDSIESAVESI